MRWDHATTVRDFVACDKGSLARGLWRDMRTSRAAVREVVSLVIDFGAGDEVLLESALRQALSLGDHRFLLDVCLCLQELSASADSALEAAIQEAE